MVLHIYIWWWIQYIRIQLFCFVFYSLNKLNEKRCVYTIFYVKILNSLGFLFYSVYFI